MYHVTAKLEDYPLPAICDSLFYVFAAIIHMWRPIQNPRTRRVLLVTADPLRIVTMTFTSGSTAQLQMFIKYMNCGVFRHLLICVL
jgi:hypothetical protein